MSDYREDFRLARDQAGAGVFFIRIKMIDPKTVLIATPTRDGRNWNTYTGGLMSCASAHLFGNVVFLGGYGARLARNIIASRFLKDSDFQWLVFIDDDIGFSADDFRILMGYPIEGLKPDPLMQMNASHVNDGDYAIVCAEYSRKTPKAAAYQVVEASVAFSDSQPHGVLSEVKPDPVRFGLGFTRIHRSVLQTLIDANDDNGIPRVGWFRNEGADYADLFPEGPGMEGKWFGEDMGFFHCCALLGITPFIETRTHLIHMGSAAYLYYPSIVEHNLADS